MLIETYFGGHSKAMVLAHEGRRATNSDIVHTVPAQIERRRSNKQKWFFGAVEFKFEPNMTVLIKNLAQKVDFWANCRSNQDCRSICAGTVVCVVCVLGLKPYKRQCCCCFFDVCVPMAMPRAHKKRAMIL